MPVVDISLLTGLTKDLRETETFAPAQIDMRNVRLTDAGNAFKRKGYSEWKDTTVEHPVIALIPENDGYAVTENGSIYTLGATVNNIYTSATWNYLPTWTVYNNKIIVAYGAAPLIIDGTSVNLLGGDPPLARFIETISSYTILAGYHPTEFTWSVPGNPESYIEDDGSGTANIQKTGTIQNMIEYKDRLLFFKEREVEVWNFVGGSSPFVRYPGGKIFQGLGAVNSVVKANDRVYWFGHEGDFYVYEGGAARVLSDQMRRRLDEMAHPEELIGYDIRKENIIMWLNPVDGLTLLFDYSKNQWLEDARWDAGWQSLPFKSYMELNRKQYFGSRNCDGLVHEWSESYRDDNGTPIRVYQRFKAALSPRGYPVRIDNLLLRREGSMATATVTAPVVDVRWRFNKGTWSHSKHVSLGAVGKHDPYAAKLWQLGLGRDFEMEIVATDATDFVMTNATITFQEMRG
jgi:hypothetical protein